MPSRRKYTTKSDLIQGILNADLSPITKRGYLTQLRTMLQQTNKSLFYILKHPEPSIAWIREWTDVPATQKAFLAAVLAVFRHNEGLKLQENGVYTAWYTAFAEVNKAIDERYKRNEPSERQKEGYVPYDEIVAKRESLPRGSDDRLLLAFYTHLPPLRCDFNRLRIYQREPGGAGASAEVNYVVVPPVGPDAPEAALVLGEFKTRNHREAAYRKALPDELVCELRASLENAPRIWVFTDRNGDPYTAGSYTKWANRTLARLFGRPLTVSLIRHSFINTLDFNRLTIAEKEAIAKDMAHTTEMQDKYRLFFDPPAKGKKSGGATEDAGAGAGADADAGGGGSSYAATVLAHSGGDAAGAS